MFETGMGNRASNRHVSVRGLRRSSRWAVLLASTLSALGPNAHADENDELGRRYFDSGAAYFAEAEYEDALAAFRKAYELSNRPEILLNIASVQERMGDLTEAIATLDEYLSKNADDPEIDTVKKRRENLAKRATRNAEAERDAAHKSTPAPTQPVAPKHETTTPSRVPAYVMLSLGALSGAGALITGLGAKSEYDTLSSDCELRRCTDNDLATGKSLALASTLLTGVSIVSVGIGAVLWFTQAPAPEQSSPQVNVAFGPGGGAASAAWRF